MQADQAHGHGLALVLAHEQQLLFALALVSVFSVSAANAASLPESKIRIIPGSSVNVVSKESLLPISVRNDYPVEVRVQIHVEAKQLNAILSSTIEKVIPANTIDTAKIPITAIVDGPVTISAWLTTFSGNTLGKDTFLRMNVNADIELTMLLGFGGAIVLLFSLGIVRTIRRSRKK